MEMLHTNNKSLKSVHMCMYVYVAVRSIIMNGTTRRQKQTKVIMHHSGLQF
jgi:hypothetical protein